MSHSEMTTSVFTTFVEQTEPLLRRALVAAFGPDRGRDATADALAYGWEHWDRVGEMDNPAGYLYRVGRDRARRARGRRALLPAPAAVDAARWVEPALPVALARLPEKQRVVVALVYGFEWSLSEVAEMLGVSKGTVQSYADRGMKQLRRRMRVEL